MFFEEVYNYNLQEKVKDAIVNNKNGFLYFSPQKTTIFVGYGQSIDKKLIENFDIEVFNLNNEGGVIVSDEGSLIIGSFFDNAKEFQELLASEICKLLISKGHKAQIIDNDIIVDDTYKVSSYSSRKFGNACFGAFQIPFTVDMDLIKLVCKKKMVKIPRGLAYYGIAFEDVFSIFTKTINIFLKSY